MNLKLHFLKLSLILLIGVGALGGLFYYINQNLQENFAGTAAVQLNVIPTTQAKRVGEEFNVSVILSGQRVDSADIYINYDSQYFQYLKEYTPTGTGFSQTSNYFDTPLIESVTPSGDRKRLRVVLTSQKALANNTVTVAFKFKATRVGTGRIQVDTATSKFTGVDSASNAIYYTITPQNLTSTVTITSLTPTPISNPGTLCTPVHSSPINNVILTSTPPTLMWGVYVTGCTRPSHYKVTVNGGGIAWESLPQTAFSYTMNGFTFRPGSTYTWSIIGCSNASCTTTSARSTNQTFRTAGTTPTPTRAQTPVPSPYVCGNADCSNKMYNVVPPITNQNAEQICVAKGWGQCAVCNVGYGPVSIHGWKPDTGSWSNTCPGGALGSFNPTKMEVCCTTRVNTPTPTRTTTLTPTRTPTLTPTRTPTPSIVGGCAPTNLAVTFTNATPSFNWTRCPGTGNRYKVEVAKVNATALHASVITTTTPYIFTGTTWPNGSYQWVVTHCNNADCVGGFRSPLSTFAMAGTTISNPPCSKRAQGDANCDDRIDAADYVCWRSQFLTRQIPANAMPRCITADFNGKDGANLLDFTIWAIGRGRPRDE